MLRTSADTIGDATRQYEWWWHNLTAFDESNTPKGFFFEYYVMNPGLKTERARTASPPCYAMLKVGWWGDDKRQLNAFFPVSAATVDDRRLSIRIGENNLATDKALRGAVDVSDPPSSANLFSDSGSLTWNLTIHKKYPFEPVHDNPVVEFLEHAGGFPMAWAVRGMGVEYDGVIVCDGKPYYARPSYALGYQDKNWGRDLVNRWVWLQCSNLYRDGARANMVTVHTGRGAISQLPPGRSSCRHARVN